MLRNYSHLYPAEIARDVLNKSAKGFKRLNLRFGEATALNNLGVLELWADRSAASRKHLEGSLGQLEELHSNEVYQPLTNLAVLFAVRGELTLADEMLERAVASVSPFLQMDQVMLDMNRLVLDLLNGRCSIEEASERATDVNERSLATRDKRFQWAANWLAIHLANTNKTFPASEHDRYSVDRLRSLGNSGLEKFFFANVAGQEIELLLVLSPHWRY